VCINHLPSSWSQLSKVCGRVTGYQYYSTDAFDPYYHNRAITIDGTYIDGVSITHGRHPRKHVWSFAAAIDETRANSYVCPCTKTMSAEATVLEPGAVHVMVPNKSTFLVHAKEREGHVHLVEPKTVVTQEG